jgi:tRNA (guanine-N7-)-methyltransferase
VGEAGFGRRTAASLLTSYNLQPPRGRLLYGRRRGRTLRLGQKNLISGLLPRLAVDIPASGHIDPGTLFRPTRQATWLEIGFGGGEHLAIQAEVHPEIGFIGCEVFENGIVKLLAQIERRHLANIRIFADDARLLIAALQSVSIDGVFILFPDPWPKRRHHKRRIVSREVVDRLAEVMTDNAELRAFEWQARRPGDWRQRTEDWPPTRYEEKARAAGRSPVFLRLRRRPRISAAQPKDLAG